MGTIVGNRRCFCRDAVCLLCCPCVLVANIMCDEMFGFCLREIVSATLGCRPAVDCVSCTVVYVKFTPMNCAQCAHSANVFDG